MLAEPPLPGSNEGTGSRASRRHGELRQRGSVQYNGPAELGVLLLPRLLADQAWQEDVVLCLAHYLILMIL